MCNLAKFFFRLYVYFSQITVFLRVYGVNQVEIIAQLYLRFPTIQLDTLLTVESEWLFVWLFGLYIRSPLTKLALCYTTSVSLNWWNTLGFCSDGASTDLVNSCICMHLMLSCVLTCAICPGASVSQHHGQLLLFAIRRDSGWFQKHGHLPALYYSGSWSGTIPACKSGVSLLTNPCPLHHTALILSYLRPGRLQKKLLLPVK